MLLWLQIYCRDSCYFPANLEVHILSANLFINALMFLL